MADYETECFFVAPFGKVGTEIRRRSDNIRDHVVRPAAARLGLETVRADDVTTPGQITLQVIDHLLRARAVVADLTGANANVYYELAIRHAARLPVVLIASVEDIDRLPFDMQNMRVIPLDHQDLASAADATTQIESQLRAALDGAVDSPVSQALNLQALSTGDTEQQTLAHLVSRVEDLAQVTQRLSRRVARSHDRTASIVRQRHERRVAEMITDRLQTSGHRVNSVRIADGELRIVTQDSAGDTKAFAFGEDEVDDIDLVVDVILDVLEMEG